MRIEGPITPSFAVCEWIKRKAGGGNVLRILEDDSAPKQLRYSGLGGDTITVGKQWLAERFPVQYVKAVLLGTKRLEVYPNELPEA